MRIDIFGLRPRPDGEWEVDHGRRVGQVFVEEGRVEVEDPSYQRSLTRLFQEDAVRMGPGDALETHAAWSRQAIDLILREKLEELSLAGEVRA